MHSYCFGISEVNYEVPPFKWGGIDDTNGARRIDGLFCLQIDDGFLRGYDIDDLDCVLTETIPGKIGYVSNWIKLPYSNSDFWKMLRQVY